MQQIPKKRFALFSIFVIILFDEIGLSIGYPILPFLCFDHRSTLFAMTTSHAARSIWYGILSGLPHMIPIISAPILAFLSDHFGRRKILLLMTVSIFIFSSFTAIGIIYGLISIVLFGAFISGLCARSEPLALAIVGDCSTPEKKIIHMGYLQFMISAGAFLGPVLGGFFATRFFFPQLNFSVPYIVGAIAGLITFLLALTTFRETFRPRKNKKIEIFAPFKELLNKNILKLAVILILTQIGWRIYYQFIPPVLKLRFHYSAMTIGIFIGLIALWLALATLIVIKVLTKSFDAHKIMQMAILILLLGLLMAAVGCQLPVSDLSQILTWLAAIPTAAGDVIAYSALIALCSNHVSEHHQGKVMGLMFMLISLVWVLTGVMGGFLAAIHIQLPILIAPISVVVLLLNSGLYSR